MIEKKNEITSPVSSLKVKDGSRSMHDVIDAGAPPRLLPRPAGPPGAEGRPGGAEGRPGGAEDNNSQVGPVSSRFF